jgi:aminopeptidase N
METVLYQGRRVKITLDSQMEFYFEELDQEDAEAFLRYFRAIDNHPVKKDPRFVYQSTRKGKHVYQYTAKRWDIRGFWMIPDKHFRIVLVTQKDENGVPFKLLAVPSVLKKAAESIKTMQEEGKL